jgi:hypothetical protein
MPRPLIPVITREEDELLLSMLPSQYAIIKV